MTQSARNNARTSMQDAQDAPVFSIIVPCFNESHCIPEFNRRLVNTLESTPFACELIYVNDGSTDGTFALLQEIYNTAEIQTSLVDLMHNVGQTNAWTAGLQYAAGRHIIFLDCDLQVAPEDLIHLMEAFDETCDMVSGVRVKRKDNLLRIGIARIGNALIRRTLNLPLHDFGSGIKILHGDFIRAFKPGPYHPINPGILMLSLRRVVEVPITHQARTAGRSRWSLRRFLVLYHNIFSHLVPFIYPFAVTPIFLFSIMLMLYFAFASIYPDIFPYANRPALVPMLIVLNILLSFLCFLLLGGTVMRSRNQAQEPVYFVRAVFLSREHNT